jgi:hypothetical protein
MVGTGEIIYPGRIKTSTAAWQLDIDLSGARGSKLGPQTTWSSRLGVQTAGQLFSHHFKIRTVRKPNTKPWKSDGYRRLKLSNRTLKFENVGGRSTSSHDNKKFRTK